MTYNRQTFVRARFLPNASQRHPSLSLRSSSPALSNDPPAKAPGAGPPRMDQASPGAIRDMHQVDSRPRQAQGIHANAPARPRRIEWRSGGYFVKVLLLLLLSPLEAETQRSADAVGPAGWLVQATACTGWMNGYAAPFPQFPEFLMGEQDGKLIQELATALTNDSEYWG